MNSEKLCFNNKIYYWLVVSFSVLLSCTLKEKLSSRQIALIFVKLYLLNKLFSQGKNIEIIYDFLGKHNLSLVLKRNIYFTQELNNKLFNLFLFKSVSKLNEL